MRRHMMGRRHSRLRLARRLRCDRLEARRLLDAAPIVKDDLFATLEDEVLSADPGVLNNDFDVDFQPLRATLVTDVEHGTLDLRPDGTFTYTPAPNYFGDDRFIYRATDTTNKSDEGSVLIQIQSVNDRPIARDDLFSVDEDRSLIVAVQQGLLQNDVDVDQDVLTVALVQPTAHGEVQLNSDGSFSYTPEQDYAGIDQFAYRADDGTDTSDAAVVTIEVRQDGSAPVAFDEAYLMTEGDVLRADGTPELSIIEIEHPVADLVADPTQPLIYLSVPSSSERRANSLITFDPIALELTNQIAIGIDPSEIVISEDGQYLFAVVEDEQAVQVYDVHAETLGAHFYMPESPNGNDGQRVRNILPIPGQPERVLAARYYRNRVPSAAGVVVYTKDGNARPQQHLDQWGPYTVAVDESGTSAYGHRAADFWDITLDDSGVRLGRLYGNGRILNGSDVTRMVVADGILLTNRGDAVNLESRTILEPFATDGNFLVNRDRHEILSIVDNETKTGLRLQIYSLETLQLLRTLEIPGVTDDTDSLVQFSTDGIAFRTVPEYGADRIVVVRSSTISGEPPQGILFNDRDANDEDAQVILVNDVQNGNLTLHPDGTFVYEPAAGFAGQDQFSYQVATPAGLSETATVSITVHQVNQPPQAHPDFPVAEEDAVLVASVADGLLANDQDPEGVSLIAELVVEPRHGTLDLSADGSYTYQPDENFIGEDHFRYRVYDDSRYSEPTTVTVTVTDTADNTHTEDDYYVLSQGRTLNADSPDFVPTEPTEIELIPAGSLWRFLDHGSNQLSAWRDPTFDDLTWKAGPGPLGYGDVVATRVSFGSDSDNKHITTYFRHEFEAGLIDYIDEFQVHVRRDDGVAIYLNGVEIVRDNLAPDAAFDDFSIDYARQDGEPFYTFSIDPALLREGTNVIAAEVHQWQPTSSDLIFELRATASLRDSGRIPGVLSNDADPDDFPLKAFLVTEPAHGTLSFNADGTFVFQPEISFVGTDQFEYSATDGFGEADRSTVSIEVISSNVPPQSRDDRYVVTPGQPLQVGVADGVLANDSDWEQMPLTAQLVAPPAYGSVSLQPDGAFQYVPADDFGLADHFTYLANDGELDGIPTTVTIEVDAPRIVVGEYFLRPDTPNQKVSIEVEGGHHVNSLSLFVQVGDGGPELVELELPPGTDGPAITALELESGTIFDGAPTVEFLDLALPQVAQASISISEANVAVPASGTLVTLTIDTTGFSEGTYDLRLEEVLSDVAGGPFATHFSQVPVHITNGLLHIAETRVVGRHLFYNESKFDGEDPSLNASDDLAIAPDKTALLTGRKATRANYTSYVRGINGIMVDIAGLPASRELTLADFEFRVGRNDDYASWPLAPVPTMLVRPAAGVRGSDRVSFAWPEGAIEQQWLAVRVRASRNLSIPEDDVFFFGNAIGESGDQEGIAIVDAADVNGALDHQRGPFDRASIDNPYDFNRDRLVSSADVIIARDHQVGALFALPLIFPRKPAPALPVLIGDVNADGVFDSADLVQVFQSAEFEDQVARNSTWGEGDWNGDQEFDTSDLVLAFQLGHFETSVAASAKSSRNAAGPLDEQMLSDIAANRFQD